MLCVAQRNRDSGIVPTTSISTNMPADYSAYLLSASPPGFDLGYSSHVRDHFSPRKSLPKTKRRSCSSEKPSIFTCSEQEYEEVTQGIASLLGEFQSTRSNSLPIRCSRSRTAMNRNGNNNNCDDDGLKKKSVTFADDLGGSLVEIRLVHENPDEPPSLADEIISNLGDDAQAAITDVPPLKLNFTQPASNYVAFREKLESSCVSLENVIVKEYHLLGTVKVKNISFGKKVVVRYTSNSWATLCDVDCAYVPSVPTGPGTSSVASPYDTFSFQLQIPPTFDPNLKIQFSIMYEANGQQFWDNNDGNNYEVIAATHQDPPAKTQDNGVFSLHHDDRWTEFSNWATVDNSIPYW